MTTKCACGRDLHYTSTTTQQMVERLIAQTGSDDVVVTVTSQRPGVGPRHFLVQRHYIALHGLKTQDLLKGRVPGAREIDAATLATLNLRAPLDLRPLKRTH